MKRRSFLKSLSVFAAPSVAVASNSEEWVKVGGTVKITVGTSINSPELETKVYSDGGIWETSDSGGPITFDPALKVFTKDLGGDWLKSA